MGDRRYIISETSVRTGLESHVLRYWEDELGLKIPRNELGHRYYTEEHIRLFCKIKELKEKGYQLKAIKSELEGKSELNINMDEIRAQDSAADMPDTADTQDAADTSDAADTQDAADARESVKQKESGAQTQTQPQEQTQPQQAEAEAACTASPALVAPMPPAAEPAHGDKLEQFRAIIGGIVTESLRENNVVLQDEITYSVSEKVIKEMDYLLRLKEESEDERFKKLDETIRNCQRSSREAAAYSEGRGWKRKHKRRV